jgi:ribosomal protein L24
MEENSEIQQWFCLGCTSPQKELKIRDDVRRYGLEAFVPLKYDIKKVRQQEQRKLVPAISGLMFAKGTVDEVKDYVSNSHFSVYIRKSTFSNKEDYLTVPTKAMDDFIAVTVEHETHITYFKPEEIKLQAGDQIRVKGGIYDGKEGIIMRIKGKRNKHLVVQIPGLLVAAVEMTPDLIELKSNKEEEEIINEKPSKNIDIDKKYLYDTAHRLLFEITNKYKEDTEYYLLMRELKRCKARLATFKGFTPATEAELALPMYMTAVVTGEGIAEAEERLRKVTDKLKDSSKLKAKCVEMMRRLNIKD